MNPSDLLRTAHVLLSSAKGKPTAASLRRAISSSYYALFHCLARQCADLLIGGSNSDRSKAAWRQVYRGLEHGPAKTKCKNYKIMEKLPKRIQSFANIFVIMQEKRHSADYDPFEQFIKSEVRADIASVENAIANFKSASTRDRRAFCAYVLIKERSN